MGYGSAYAESKLHVVALALFVARRWPGVLSNAVDPGWVRTPMGGASAPVDIDTGPHMKPELPAHEAMDVAFQDKMVARLQDLTGVALPEAGERFHRVIAPKA